MAAHLPPPRCANLKPQANNQSSAIGGVSKTVKFDRRRGTESLVFQVSWKDGDGIARNKTFSAGRIGHFSPADEELASDAAESFRRAYVAASEQRMPFDPTPWVDWKEQRWR